jgi:hypothetical protein
MALHFLHKKLYTYERHYEPRPVLGVSYSQPCLSHGGCRGPVDTRVAPDAHILSESTTYQARYMAAGYYAWRRVSHYRALHAGFRLDLKPTLIKPFLRQFPVKYGHIQVQLNDREEIGKEIW